MGGFVGRYLRWRRGIFTIGSFAGGFLAELLKAGKGLGRWRGGRGGLLGLGLGDDGLGTSIVCVSSRMG
ncbi:MAG TPA: hypothetical protein DIT13_07770, partial [Verrucomicrobiales bacterium]|nr:hypothetical protein [Verrucomicrobiales bacterium]